MREEIILPAFIGSVNHVLGWKKRAEWQSVNRFITKLGLNVVSVPYWNYFCGFYILKVLSTNKGQNGLSAMPKFPYCHSGPDVFSPVISLLPSTSITSRLRCQLTARRMKVVVPCCLQQHTWFRSCSFKGVSRSALNVIVNGGYCVEKLCFLSDKYLLYQIGSITVYLF